MQLVQQGSKIILERGDSRKLVWDVSIYDRTKYTTVEGMFNEINGYFGHISEGRREAIWKAYEAIYYTLYNVFEPTHLINRLMDEVAELYNHIVWNELEHWVKFRGGIRFPLNMRDAIDPEETSKSIRDRTYVKQDYIGLVVLAVALRPMVPIWGEYISRIMGSVGASYKEYVAMKLLFKSYIVNVEPMNRLMQYVKGSINGNEENVSSILQGLGSDERPQWLLSMVVLRRVATGDITVRVDDKASLITNIFSFVTNQLADMDKKFGGVVKAKFREEYGDESDKASQIELYKVNQTVSYGDIAMYGYYAEDYERMARHLDPSIPMEMVRECVGITSQLTEYEIREMSVVLCQWVVNPVITARAVSTLNMRSMLNVLGVTQALIWHWGFPELAGMLVSTQDLTDNRNFIPSESRARIPTDLQRQLNEIYPYFENQGRSKGQGAGKNVAVKAIQTLAKEFIVARWIIHAPEALKRELNCQDHGRLLTPVNHMELLARLVIRITQDEGV